MFWYYISLSHAMLVIVVLLVMLDDIDDISFSKRRYFLIVSWMSISVYCIPTRDTHITRDMCMGIHISRGYTYHCDTGINFSWRHDGQDHPPRDPYRSDWRVHPPPPLAHRPKPDESSICQRRLTEWLNNPLDRGKGWWTRQSLL